MPMSGKLAVAEAGQLVQATICNSSRLDEADEGGKHGVCLSLKARRLEVQDPAGESNYR